MAKKKLENENIVAALIQSGSVTEAAATLQITRKTLYKHLHDPELLRLYNAQKMELVQSATAKMQSNLSGAIDTLVGIANDTDKPPQVRVSACNSILGYCARYTEISDLLRRIETIEREGV